MATVHMLEKLAYSSFLRATWSPDFVGENLVFREFIPFSSLPVSSYFSLLLYSSLFPFLLTFSHSFSFFLSFKYLLDILCLRPWVELHVYKVGRALLHQ